MSEDRMTYDDEIDHDGSDEASNLSDDDYVTIDRIIAQQGDGDDLVSVGDGDRAA